MEICIAYYPSPHLKDPYCILLCLKIATAFQRQLQKTALYNELSLRYGVLIGVRSWDKHLSEQERENKVQQQTQCHRISQRLLICPLFFFSAGAVTYPWTFFQTNWEIAVASPFHVDYRNLLWINTGFHLSLVPDFSCNYFHYFSHWYSFWHWVMDQQAQFL